MFNKQFFLQHQGKLLWLLNTPVVRKWFRYVLRIRGDSSSIGSHEIRGILPNAILWWGGRNRKAEFRTHAKFSKRLYYAFAPLWWAMHFWDWCVADRWVPELSFGFATLEKYPDADPETDTVDGYAEHNVGAGASWAAIRDGAGTSADDLGTAGTIYAPMWIKADTTTNEWQGIDRGIFLFNTSALTAAADISAAVMSLYGTTKSDPTSIAPNIDVYTSAPASNTALAAGDFDSLGTVSQTGTPITYAGWSITGYNDFTFNATGRGNISKTSISKFGTRNANYDVANTAPTWDASLDVVFDCNCADQTGTANDPKLVVTYDIPETVPYVVAYVTRTDLFAGTTR